MIFRQFAACNVGIFGKTMHTTAIPFLHFILMIKCGACRQNKGCFYFFQKGTPTKVGVTSNWR